MLLKMPFRLSADLKENKNNLQNIFANDCTFRMRELTTGGGLSCLLCFLDGMADGDTIDSSIVRPLVESRTEPLGDRSISEIHHRILFAGEVSVVNFAGLVKGILYGDTLLLAQGCSEGLLINTKGWKTRGISEPENERVEQGPREGFDEAALHTLALIRRKLRTTDFCIRSFSVGRRSETGVYLCYLESLTNSKTVERLEKQIRKIDIDGILDSNYLSELMEDGRHSMFPTTGSTERPDVVASKLLEGRIAIVVDGTPVVLTVPCLFGEHFQSDEDYYLNFWGTSPVRMLRYICFFFTVAFPGFYLALINCHQRLLPTFLLLSAAKARSGVPFSSLWECLILIVLLEILKEAGARMPQSLGHTLSIVGGLVVGQAAVEARLISAPMLISVAFAGIAGLMIPKLRGGIFYWRIGLVLLGYGLGLPGIFFGLCLLMIYLLRLTSFGVPYLSTLGKPGLQGWKDTVVRLPWNLMQTRPDFNRNLIRQRRKRK